MDFHFDTAYALSVSFEHTPHYASRYRPRKMQKGVPFHDNQRWEGYAAALGMGYIERMFVVGGFEPLSSRETTRAAREESTTRINGDGFLVNRGWAGAHYLHQEHGICLDRAKTLVSASNTQGNYLSIRNHLADNPKMSVCLLTGFVHLPRALMIAQTLGMSHLPHFPSEAFVYVYHRKKGLSQSQAMEMVEHGFGGDDTARRMSAEVAGIGDLILGIYTPREM